MTVAATSPQTPALHEYTKGHPGKCQKEQEQRRQEGGHGVSFASWDLKRSVMIAFVPFP